MLSVKLFYSFQLRAFYNYQNLCKQAFLKGGFSTNCEMASSANKKKVSSVSQYFIFIVFTFRIILYIEFSSNYFDLLLSLRNLSLFIDLVCIKLPSSSDNFTRHFTRHFQHKLEIFVINFKQNVGLLVLILLYSIVLCVCMCVCLCVCVIICQ